MSSKTYDEDDIERLAKRIGEEFKREFRTYIEESEDREKAVQKHFDAIVQKETHPLSGQLNILASRMSAGEVALRATDSDVRIIKKRTEKLEEFAGEVTDHGIRLSLLEQSR